MDAIEDILDLASRPVDDLDDDQLLEAYREAEAKRQEPDLPPAGQMYLTRRVNTIGEEIMDRGRSLAVVDGTIKYATEADPEPDE